MKVSISTKRRNNDLLPKLEGYKVWIIYSKDYISIKMNSKFVLQHITLILIFKNKISVYSYIKLYIINSVV